MQGIGGWTLSAGPSGPPDRNKAAAAHEAFVEAEDAGEEDDAWLTADEGEFSRASSRTTKTGTHVTFAKASVRRESLGAAPDSAAAFRGSKHRRRPSWPPPSARRFIVATDPGRSTDRSEGGEKTTQR